MSEKKKITQNAGFIAKEAQRVQEYQEKAKERQAAGNERAAKYFNARANNGVARIEKAAENIKKWSKS